MQTADSLLTDEQREQRRKLKIKIAHVIMEKVCVEDNRLVLKATILDFADRGIPELYYYSLLEEFEETNRCVNLWNINNMDELLEQSKQQYQDSLVK